MKILHIEPRRYPDQVKAMLKEKGMEVDYAEVDSHSELINLLTGTSYEALFVKLGIAIDVPVLQTSPALRYIITPTTGLDHIDMEAAGARGITVLSLRGETTFLRTIQSTAEHTWAMLLALIRHIPAAYEDVLAGHWRRDPFLAGELNGRTLGIIGYGRLGRIVGRYGLAFDMQVLVNDTDPGQLAVLPEGVRAASLDRLLSESDILSLHIPSHQANYHFFDKKKIDRTKKGVILINTSRGEVMEEEALLEGLYSGHIAGAGLDVLEGDSSWEKTLPELHPLRAYAAAHANLIITPHMGGYGATSIEKTRIFMTEKFLRSALGA